MHVVHVSEARATWNPDASSTSAAAIGAVITGQAARLAADTPEAGNRASDGLS